MLGCKFIGFPKLLLPLLPLNKVPPLSSSELLYVLLLQMKVEMKPSDLLSAFSVFIGERLEKKITVTHGNNYSAKIRHGLTICCHPHPASLYV